MNVFRLHPKYAFLFFFLASIPFISKAQNFDPLVKLSVIQGQNLNYNYQSLGGPAQTFVVSSTNNCGGTVLGPYPLGSNNYKIVYNNPANPGKDTVTIHLKKPPQGFSTYRIIEITVIPSLVNAENDFTTTLVGQNKTIQVTTNDISNRGVLNLREVAMANNGTASISNNAITFTPDQGFEGIANFDYVVCDDIGTCDKATVHVCVGDPYGHSSDTLNIITIKNKSIPVLTPLTNYILVSPPAHGNLQTINGILHYQPHTNYAGMDAFYYRNVVYGYFKTVRVDVLNVAAPNQFVKDDLSHTIKNNGVIINVLANDLASTGLYHVQITNNPIFGTLQELSEGVYEYIPNQGFEGVDEFRYSASPNANGSNAETGIASIIVSNQNPRSPIFNLQTPKNQPLIINYNIPVQDFDFVITSQALKGTVVYLPGQVDTIINNQQIVGFNLLVYTPNNGELGWDEFEAEYCVSGNQNCPLVKVRIDIQDFTPPNNSNCIGTDCVWAGDVNKDGLVDMRDLLPMGWCIGDVGKPRANATINPWYGQECSNWGQKFQSSNIDLKHIDANGDSLITSADTTALATHFQKTHSLAPAPVNFPTNIPLFLGTPDTIYVNGPGDIITIPILLGHTVQPALNVYGLTFSIDYDANVVNAAQSKILFDNNSWMSYTSPILGMFKKPYAGRLDAGFTRTNGVSSDGYGRIGEVKFIIVDDLDPTRLPEKSIARISGSVMSGNGIAYTFEPKEFAIKFKSTQKPEVDLAENELSLFPNPSSQVLNVQLQGNADILQIQILDLAGRLISQTPLSGVKKHEMDISNLSNGLFMIRVNTSAGVLSKKFEVIR